MIFVSGAGSQSRWEMTMTLKFIGPSVPMNAETKKTNSDGSSQLPTGKRRIRKRRKRYGVCPKCGIEQPLTRHHLTPRRFYGRQHNNWIVLLCRKCHDNLEQRIPFKRIPKRFYISIYLTFMLEDNKMDERPECDFTEWRVKPKLTSCAHCNARLPQMMALRKEYYNENGKQVEDFCGEQCRDIWYLNQLNKKGL